MPTDPTETVAAWAKALSDPIRVRVAAQLAEAEGTPTSLADRFGMSMPLASYHLCKLRDGGLVRVDRRGKSRIYSLLPGIADLVRGLVRVAENRP